MNVNSEENPTCFSVVYSSEVNKKPKGPTFIPSTPCLGDEFSEIEVPKSEIFSNLNDSGISSEHSIHDSGAVQNVPQMFGWSQWSIDSALKVLDDVISNSDSKINSLDHKPNLHGSANNSTVTSFKNIKPKIQAKTEAKKNNSSALNQVTKQFEKPFKTQKTPRVLSKIVPVGSLKQLCCKPHKKKHGSGLETGISLTEVSTVAEQPPRASSDLPKEFSQLNCERNINVIKNLSEPSTKTELLEECPEFFVTDGADLTVGNLVECTSVSDDVRNEREKGRRQKQQQPRKSPTLKETLYNPRFRGAVLKIAGLVPDKNEYKVQIEHKFVNLPKVKKSKHSYDYHKHHSEGYDGCSSSDISSEGEDSSAEDTAYSFSSDGMSGNSDFSDLETRRDYSHLSYSGRKFRFKDMFRSRNSSFRASLTSLRHRRRIKTFSTSEKRCASCSTAHTPLWRDAEDRTPLCNACGIRYKKYRLRCSVCWHIPRKNESPRKRCKICGAKLKISGFKRSRDVVSLGFRGA